VLLLQLLLLRCGDERGCVPAAFRSLHRSVAAAAQAV
jgi:hypothetical protein